MKHEKVTIDSLSEIMDFDHVVRVHEDGSVSDEPNLFAPGLYGDEATGEEWIDGSGWEFFSIGYTGQYGYSGPIMHNSELLSGALAYDILATPGVYVSCYVKWLDAENEDTDTIEGWAILKKSE